MTLPRNKKRQCQEQTRTLEQFDNVAGVLLKEINLSTALGAVAHCRDCVINLGMHLKQLKQGTLAHKTILL